MTTENQDKPSRSLNFHCLGEVIRTSDREFMLDLSLAFCHYYERKVKQLGEESDMKVGAAIAQTICRIEGVYDDIQNTPQLTGET